MKSEREIIADAGIRTIREYGHGFVDGKFEEDGSIIAMTRYDRSGNAVEAISYTSDGSEEDVCFMKHDERGNVIEEHRSRGSEITLRRYSYSPDGRIIEQRIESPCGSARVEYTYDDDSGTIVEAWFNEKGMPDGTYTSRLDGASNIVERLCTRPGGLPYRLYTQKFDDEGRPVEKFFYELSGEIFKKITFSYGEDGVLQSILIYNRPDRPDMMVRYDYETY